MMSLINNNVFYIVFAIFCIILLSYCFKNKSKKVEKNTEEENLIIKLVVTPEVLSYSDRKDFKVSFSATNKNAKAYDPEFHQTKLLINDKESAAWMYAIGNGKRESKWHSLPPDETVSLSWSTLGEQLFPSSGEYTLQLALRSIQSEPIKIIVKED